MPASLYTQHMLIAGGFTLIFIVTLCTFMFTRMYFNHWEKRYIEQEEPPC